MADLAANHQASPEVLAWFESRVTYTGWLGKSHGTFVRANIATAQVKKLSDAQALGLTQKDMSHQCAVVMESDSASLQEQYDQLMALPVRPTVIVYSGGLEPGSLHAYWLFTNPREWTQGDPILDVVTGLAAAYPIVDAKAHPRNPIQWSRGLTGRHMKRCRGQVIEGNEQAAIGGTNEWYTVEELEDAFAAFDPKAEDNTTSARTVQPFEAFDSLPPAEQAKRVRESEEVFPRWAQVNPRWLEQGIRGNHPEWIKAVMALCAYVGKVHARRIVTPLTDDQAIVDAIDGYEPGRITGRSLFFVCGQPSPVSKTKSAEPVQPVPIPVEGRPEIPEVNERVQAVKFSDPLELIRTCYPCRFNTLTRQIERMDGSKWERPENAYLHARAKGLKCEVEGPSGKPVSKHVAKQEFCDAVLEVAHEQEYSPPQEFLKELKQRYRSGELKPERIDNVASRFLCATPDRLADRIVEVALVAMVRRILKPGTKFHLIPVLKGKQNFGKSHFLEALAGLDWFTDSAVLVPGVNGARDNLMTMHSAVLVECAELQTRKSCQDEMKRLITSSVDVFREPYARAAECHPRGFTVWATTNNDEFLADETGSRRFGVINVTRDISRGKERKEISDARAGLWLGASLAVEGGAECWLSKDELTVSQKRNQDYETVSLYQEEVRAILSGWHLEYITLDEVFRKLQIPKEGQGRAMKDVTKAMRFLEWAPRQMTINKVRSKYWIKPEVKVPLEVEEEAPVDISDFE